MLGSLQEPKRARLGSAQPISRRGFGRAGRAWGSSPRPVWVRLLCEHCTESGARRGEEGRGSRSVPSGRTGRRRRAPPGPQFPVGEALAPPPGAGSGCGDPPRPPRLPPPGHVRAALPEACAGRGRRRLRRRRRGWLHFTPPHPHSPWDCGRRRPPPRPPALPAPGGPGPASSGGAPPRRPPHARPGPAAPALPAGSRAPLGFAHS